MVSGPICPCHATPHHTLPCHALAQSSDSGPEVASIRDNANIHRGPSGNQPSNRTYERERLDGGCGTLRAKSSRTREKELAGNRARVAEEEAVTCAEAILAIGWPAAATTAVKSGPIRSSSTESDQIKPNQTAGHNAAPGDVAGETGVRHRVSATVGECAAHSAGNATRPSPTQGHRPELSGSFPRPYGATKWAAGSPRRRYATKGVRSGLGSEICGRPRLAIRSNQTKSNQIKPLTRGAEHHVRMGTGYSLWRCRGIGMQMRWGLC